MKPRAYQRSQAAAIVRTLTYIVFIASFLIVALGQAPSPGGVTYPQTVTYGAACLTSRC